ncbi:carbonic anhydrase [Beijerinckia indica]|uniref:carbonic anhydrase n=1 Tax=Beijerinckia indica subsp. indica (strain ATCC 9039 / DSM 1715 / NCIMB 8712) TaxID=395963 RepID=B2IJ66_BEII9|nr:carbonic anhydrase [Beijerinckia indica]ACB94829.1 Carbonate dehydratase [Beijerinckia indica subsp. indica ATCC 9039]
MSDLTPPPSSDDPNRLLLPPHLVEGYEAFLTGRFKQERDHYRHLAEAGQKPRVMLIGCCDSRVSPEVIFDVDHGDIFVVRNVAALVPPYHPNNDLHGTSAALEFGIMGLRIEHIVVMGHARCGGIKNFAHADADPYQRPLSSGDFIGKWMSLIEPAAARLGHARDPLEKYVEDLALESIIQSLINLRTFPWIKNLEERGIIKLHGAYFDIANAVLRVFDPLKERFVAISSAIHAEAFAEPRF